MIFAFALGIRIFERQNPFHDFEKFFNAIWFSVVTAVTLGYGDILPITQVGRVLAATLGIVGFINTYFVTLVMINKVSLLNSESQILEKFCKAKLTSDLEEVSGSLMRTMMKLNLLKRRKWHSTFGLKGRYHMYSLYKQYRRYIDLRNDLGSLCLFDELKTIEGIVDLGKMSERNHRTSRALSKMTKDWSAFVEFNH
jgi:hypothetical protein